MNAPALYSLSPPITAAAALVSIFTSFQTYHVEIIKAPSQRGTHSLSSPFYTILCPSFLPFVSPFLLLAPPFSLLLSSSLSEGIERISERGEQLGFASFTPMTETCWGTESGDFTNPNKSTSFSLRLALQGYFCWNVRRNTHKSFKLQ